MTWRKSSHSMTNGNCAEVGWRKPARSMGNGNCVEVGSGPLVMVRDTTDRVGATLEFPAVAWRAFTASLA